MSDRSSLANSIDEAHQDTTQDGLLFVVPSGPGERVAELRLVSKAELVKKNFVWHNHPINHFEELPSERMWVLLPVFNHPLTELVD